MDQKLGLLKDFAELEVCLVSIEDADSTNEIVCRSYRAAYALLDEIYKQLNLI